MRSRSHSQRNLPVEGETSQQKANKKPTKSQPNICQTTFTFSCFTRLISPNHRNWSRRRSSSKSPKHSIAPVEIGKCSCFRNGQDEKTGPFRIFSASKPKCEWDGRFDRVAVSTTTGRRPRTWGKVKAFYGAVPCGFQCAFHWPPTRSGSALATTCNQSPGASPAVIWKPPYPLVPKRKRESKQREDG